MKDPMLDRYLEDMETGLRLWQKGAPHPRRSQKLHYPRHLRQRRATCFWVAVCCWAVGAVILVALLKEMGIL